MSFAQPGSGSFKGFLALGNKENASEFGGQGHKLCYYFTQGDYKTWESKKGISDAIDIEVIENERVVIDGKTLQKYNLILKRVPELETMSAYIEIPANIITAWSPSLGRSLHVIYLYNQQGEHIMINGYYAFVEVL